MVLKSERKHHKISNHGNLAFGELKHSKKLLMFGILTVGIIGLVASSPTIYAIVEPHITINMDPGQTTKPFQINDDLGSEVFSVNPDGTFFASNTILIHTAKTDLFQYSNNVDNGRGDFFGIWQVTKQPGVENLGIITSSCGGQVEAHEISGTSSSKAGFFVSQDNEVSYTDFGSININSIPLTLREMFPQNLGFPKDTTHIAIGLGFSDDGNIGEARNFNFFCFLHLPEGFTVTRVI